jgi:hypothetical protein
MTSGIPSKATLRTKAIHETKELAIIAAYLYVAFGALIMYKAAILNGQGIGWTPWGLAAIKALLIAKFVLIGHVMKVGERYRTKALIWQTLYSSLIFLVIVFILDMLEEIIVGSIHGRALLQSILAVGGGTPQQLGASLLLLFLIFFPYFAFRSLSAVMGKGVLVRLFFVEPRMVNEGSKPKL